MHTTEHRLDDSDISGDEIMSETLAQIIAELSDADDVEGIPTRLLDAVIRSTPFDQCWAGVFDLRTHTWTREHQAGFDPEVVESWKTGRIWTDESEPSIVAIHTGAPVVLPDVLRANQFSSISARSAQEGYRASLYIPVRLSDDEWTVMSLHRSVAHQFTQIEQALAAAIATFAAIAFRNAIARDRAVDAHRVANETITAQNELLQHRAEVQRQLLQAQLRGGGIQAICEILGSLLRSPIVLLDRFHQIVARVGLDADEATQLASELTPTLREPHNLSLNAGPTIAMVSEKRVLIGTASDGHTLMGICLAMPSGSFGLDVDASVMELGCLYLSLEIAHQRTTIEAELRLQDDFVNALISGGESELSRRSSILGLDLSSPRRVYRARVRGALGRLARADSTELAGFVRRRLSETVPGAVVAATKPSDIVTVLPEKLAIGDVAATIRRALRDGLSALTFVPASTVSVTVGIGDAGTGIAGLAQSQSGATRALEVLEAMRRTNQELYIGNAGSSALLTIPPAEQKRAFVDRYLKNLLEHDDTSNTELVETLRVYFAQVGNVKRTADAMFLHISTVRHRLARIEKLANISLRDEDERLCLQLALRLADIVAPKTREHR